uniref:RNA-directed DNA polymerase n=1 Tax=Caenorhabditis japonica TaxID=281687 RepID=A0A8R1DJ98_CAEJA
MLFLSLPFEFQKYANPGLKQHVLDPTRYNPDNILDLCLSNTSIISNVKVGELFSDHRLLTITLSISIKRQVVTRSVLNFKKADYTAINYYLSNINWNYILSSAGATMMYDSFLQILMNLINIFVPTIVIKPFVRRHGMAIMKLLKSKRKIWRLEGNSLAYKEASNMLKKELLLEDQCNTEKCLVNGSSNDFYRFINKRMHVTENVGLLVNKNRNIIEDYEKAEIFSSTFAEERDLKKEQERDLKEVLSRLRRSGLKLRATKCHIAQENVEYLGHQVTPEGVQTEEKKVEQMKSFAKPTNAKELLSFLGLVEYYRKFIINFAKLAAPLTQLTSKKVCWKWENEQEDAFQKLIQAVCQAPVLAQPNVDVALEGKRPFMIYTDASRQGVGAVFAQEGADGMQHPIAFASKSLTPAETRYHVTDLEALAMMFALRRFKTIVYGTRVVVCTDHKPLISLLKGSPLADRLLRWWLEILEFNVKIVYVAGKANVVADALSRGGALGVDSTEGETTELTNVINEVRTAFEKEDILNTENWFEYLRQEDEGWKVVVEQLENDFAPFEHDAPYFYGPWEYGPRQGVLKIVGVKGGVNLHDFCLIRKSLRNIENPSHSRRVVPMCAREALIKEYHEGAYAGHFGTEKLMRQLSKKFMWPQMRSSIEKIVKACSKCICTNDYPKMAFAERWAVGEGRIPHTLLTDQSKEFANGLFEQFNTMLKIKHVMTKGYNSRANGAVEGFNKTIMHIVKKKVALPIEWDDQLPYAVYAYNSIAHRTTGDTPYFIMTGRDPQGPLIMEGEDAGGMNNFDMEDYKCVLTHELLVAHKKAKEHARSEWEGYKRLFDSKHKVHSRKYPQPGSRVLLPTAHHSTTAACRTVLAKGGDKNGGRREHFDELVFELFAICAGGDYEKSIQEAQ